MKKIPFSFVRDGLVGKAKLAVLSNDTPGAIDIYRDLLLRPVKATMNGTEYASWDRLADIESLIVLDPQRRRDRGGRGLSESRLVAGRYQLSMPRPATMFCIRSCVCS